MITSILLQIFVLLFLLNLAQNTIIITSLDHKNMQGQGSSTSEWVPKIPPECEDNNLCDMKIPNYPKRSFIKRTLRKLQKEGYVIGLDRDPFAPTPPAYGPNDSELCRSHTRKIFANAAKDSNTNKWRFVINDPYEPVQIVTVEVCSKPEAPCDNLSSKYFKIRPGYQASCVQKYFRKSLLGYNETGHVIHFQTSVPMCCACVGYHH